MDQHEKDWIRLGQDLRNYQPPGDPAADFAAFQQLQQAEATSPKRAIMIWLGLGLFLLLASAAWLVTGDQELGEPQSMVETSPLATAAEEATEVQSPVSKELLGQVPAPTQMGTQAEKLPVKVPGKTAEVPTRLTATTTTTTTTTTDAVDFSESAPEQSVELAPAVPARKATESSKLAVMSLRSGEKASLVYSNELPSVSLTGIAPPIEIEQQSRLPRVSFGAGLSSHWRGDRFMSDTDQGVYVTLGLQQPLGQRFSLAGRVGYRGHNLNLRVFEDDKPWSHYEEKINEVDASGEEVEYTYVGIVDGYKGIEFSLLLQYQLNNRTTLQAGGRYSLPSLAFRRTVHSSRDGDITAEPSPYHFLANEQPLVKYYDYGGLLGAQYRINNTLSFEAQVHLGMVDLIEDDGERMNRFNHSSSLSLGLRYRLN